ncbi:MAG: VOC family protein [Flavobacterium sp.]|nr:MAG: VOC family protein [Flavobacterium sp.]
MAAVNPYLLFNGNCEEAFLFYKSVFGGEFPYMGRFSEAPPEDGGGEQLSEADANRIMHVSLPIGNTILMGSDSHPRYGDVLIGSNFQISINVDSTEEADRIFDALSAGGKPYMPMSKTFWGAYFGMFQDKFEISWMVNFDENMTK